MREPSPTNLNEPATKGDLIQLQQEQKETQAMLRELREEFRGKKFYTIAEFHAVVGPTVAVIQKYCTIGKLKATQVVKGGSWCIYASEIDRMRKEAMENHYDKSKSTSSTDRAVIKKMKELGIPLKKEKA